MPDKQVILKLSLHAEGVQIRTVAHMKILSFDDFDMISLLDNNYCDIRLLLKLACDELQLDDPVPLCFGWKRISLSWLIAS